MCNGAGSTVYTEVMQFFGDTCSIPMQQHFFLLILHSLLYATNGNIDYYSTGECEKSFAEWESNMCH